MVVVQEEFDAELPVDADANDATGTGPLAGLGADFDVRLTMRDVILVSKGSKVKVGKTRKVLSLTKSAKYSIAAGASKTLSLSLTAQAKALLKKTKSLSVTVTVKPTTGAAVTRKVTLKA